MRPGARSLMGMPDRPVSGQLVHFYDNLSGILMLAINLIRCFKQSCWDAHRAAWL